MKTFYESFYTRIQGIPQSFHSFGMTWTPRGYRERGAGGKAARPSLPLLNKTLTGHSDRREESPHLLTDFSINQL